MIHIAELNEVVRPFICAHESSIVQWMEVLGGHRGDEERQGKIGSVLLNGLSEMRRSTESKCGDGDENETD